MSGGQEPGLALCFSNIIRNKRDYAELKGLSPEEARERLFIQWDSEPFGFDFGQVQPDATIASGGGGGDGGGGGGGGSDPPIVWIVSVFTQS